MTPVKQHYKDLPQSCRSGVAAPVVLSRFTLGVVNRSSRSPRRRIHAVPHNFLQGQDRQFLRERGPLSRLIGATAAKFFDTRRFEFQWVTLRIDFLRNTVSERCEHILIIARIRSLACALG